MGRREAEERREETERRLRPRRFQGETTADYVPEETVAHGRKRHRPGDPFDDGMLHGNGDDDSDAKSPVALNSPVKAGTNRIEGMIDQFESTVKALEERLATALGPDRPPDGGFDKSPRDAVKTRCDLAEYLHSVADRLMDLNSDLLNLVSRIEL